MHSFPLVLLVLFLLFITQNTEIVVYCSLLYPWLWLTLIYQSVTSFSVLVQGNYSLKYKRMKMIWKQLKHNVYIYFSCLTIYHISILKCTSVSKFSHCHIIYFEYFILSSFRLCLFVENIFFYEAFKCELIVELVWHLKVDTTESEDP